MGAHFEEKCYMLVMLATLFQSDTKDRSWCRVSCKLIWIAKFLPKEITQNFQMFKVRDSSLASPGCSIVIGWGDKTY